jgi:dTDP-4-dehydrorhamnose reductase
MTELLVIGGGLLGREVARRSREEFKTAVTYNSNPQEVEGCASYQMDITRSTDLVRSLSPQYVVLTAAMTNVDRCETDPEGAWKANALGPKNLAMAAKEAGSKLIYISTDYVFDGERCLYREGEQTNPINCYGKSKLEGEIYAREICPDCLIARTSVLYGWNPNRPNFITWVISELRQGRRVNIVQDQHNTPTLSSNLADQIMAILDETGVFHTCGSERISRFDFASKAARAFCLDESLINPITTDQLSWKAKRPMDSSLDTSRVSRFAKPLSVDEGLRAMTRDEENC